jgi:hypothetical protein
MTAKWQYFIVFSKEWPRLTLRPTSIGNFTMAASGQINLILTDTGFKTGSSTSGVVQLT